MFTKFTFSWWYIAVSVRLEGLFLFIYIFFIKYFVFFVNNNSI